LGDHLRRNLPWLGLFAFAALLYANTLRNGFVLDDASLILQNPMIRSLANAPRFFASDYWEPTLKADLYRPLVTTSYALNYGLGKLDPESYHAVNLLLHALNAVLVWLLFRQLPIEPLVATAAAFFFAAHAVHTEAVANVVGRAELLCTAFFLGALLCQFAAQRSDALDRRRYAAALSLYVMALLCKENAVTLPGVVILHDIVYIPWRARGLLQRLGFVLRDRSLRVYAGYVATTLVYLAIRFVVLGRGEPINPISPLDNPLASLPFPWRLVNALLVAWRYAGLLLYPRYLSYDYSYNAFPMLSSFADPSAALLLASAAALALWLWLRPRWPDLFFALGFALLTFSVVSNIFLLIGTILGERLLYLPSIGFCLAVALVVRRACERLPLGERAISAVFLAFFAVTVGLHSWRTVVRNRNWTAEEDLDLHDLALYPGSAKVVNNAGVVMAKLGRLEEAVPLLRRATEITPNQVLPFVNLAGALYQLGRVDEALPVYEAATHLPGAPASAFNDLGLLLLDRGIDRDRAIQLIENAVKLEPKNASYLESLGLAYYNAGRLEEARQLIQESLDLDSSGESGQRKRGLLEEVERAIASADGQRG
jgi:tetratricopeptide (TPR) repeat protein